MDRSLRFDVKIIQKPFVLQGIDLSDFIKVVSGTTRSSKTYETAELIFKILEQ